MSLGTGTYKVDRGPDAIETQQGGTCIHGNPASGNYPYKRPPTVTVTMKGIQWKYLPNPILT